MRLQLPRFDGSFCQYFMACGLIQSEDRSLKLWLEKQPPVEIRFRAAGQMAFLQAMCDGRRGFHVHFDVATAAHFTGRGRRPDPTHQRRDVQCIFSHIAGNDIDVSIEAELKFPVEVFPGSPLIQAIQSLEYASEDGKTRLRSLGIELTTEGESVERVRCSLEEGEARVELRMYSTAKIDDLYLVNTLKLIDESLDRMFRRVPQ